MIPAILLSFLFMAGRSQQPAYYESLAIYEDALTLLAKEKYGAAKEKLNSFLSSTQPGSIKSYPNDLRAEAEYYSALCSFHLLRNDASHLFSRFIATHKTHPKKNDSWYYKGKLQYLKKDFPGSIKALEKIKMADLSPPLAQDATFMLGWSYYTSGELEKAAPIFFELKSQEGEQRERAAYYYGMIRYEAGDYLEAMAMFEEIGNSRDVFASDLPVLTGNCMLKLKMYDELDRFHLALQDSSVNPGADFYRILANSMFEQGRWKESAENYELFSIRRGSMMREDQFRYAYCSFKIKDWPKAIEKFEKVLVPRDEMAQSASYFLGHCFLELKNDENARTAFRKASEMDFEKSLAIEALYQYSLVSFSTKYFEDALIGFQKLINQYPDSPFAGESKGHIGEILLYSGKYEEAIEYFEKSTLKSDRTRRAYQAAAYSYGVDLFEKELFTKASQYFRVAVNHSFDKDLTLSAYFWLAEGEFREGRYTDAVRQYEVYLDQPIVHKHQNFTGAHFGLGWSKFKSESYPEALGHFEKFIALSDQNESPALLTDAILRSGDCEFVRKNFLKALSYYKQVTDMKRRNLDYSLYQTGRCYQRLDKYKDAVAAFTDLANNYKKSEYRDDALLLAADIYIDFLTDWSNGSRYASELIEDYPKSPHVPSAYNIIGIAAANSKDKEKAIQNFKYVVLNYCSDESNALTALDNLSTMLPAKEYDRVYAQFREDCPGGQSVAICDLDYRTGFDRFYADEFETALPKFNSYLTACPNGQYSEEVMFLRGKCFEKTGQTDSALADYKRVYSEAVAGAWAVDALESAAEIMFNQGNHLSSIQLFLSMEDVADKLEDKVASQFGRAKNYVAMQDFELAMNVYMSIYTDPDATQYSRDRSHVQIATCKFHLGEKQEAFAIFTEIEQKFDNAFAAESQYMITKILFDKGEFEQSKSAGLYLKDNYPKYREWIARVFLIVAEDYLQLGDTFQCEGNLERLILETRFPDVSRAATIRYAELQALKAKTQPANENENSDDGKPEEGIRDGEEGGEE